MYTNEMLESIKKVEATREERVKRNKSFLKTTPTI